MFVDARFVDGSMDPLVRLRHGSRVFLTSREARNRAHRGEPGPRPEIRQREGVRLRDPVAMGGNDDEGTPPWGGVAEEEAVLGGTRGAQTEHRTWPSLEKCLQLQASRTTPPDKANPAISGKVFCVDAPPPVDRFIFHFSPPPAVTLSEPEARP